MQCGTDAESIFMQTLLEYLWHLFKQLIVNHSSNTKLWWHKLAHCYGKSDRADTCGRLRSLSLMRSMHVSLMASSCEDIALSWLTWSRPRSGHTLCFRHSAMSSSRSTRRLITSMTLTTDYKHSSSLSLYNTVSQSSHSQSTHRGWPGWVLNFNTLWSNEVALMKYIQWVAVVEPVSRPLSGAARCDPSQCQRCRRGLRPSWLTRCQCW